MPIQASLSSMFTIGIPSFILALEPNNEKIDNNSEISYHTDSTPPQISLISAGSGKTAEEERPEEKEGGEGAHRALLRSEQLLHVLRTDLPGPPVGGQSAL